MTALDYEIYDPNVDDEYAEFKNGIIAIFDGSNPGGETDINRAIWLYEAGMSALLRDTAYTDFDTIITDSRAVSFTVSENGKLMDSDFANEFAEDYDEVVAYKLQNPHLDYQFTDVQFVSIENGELNLKVVNHFYVNGTRNMWDAPLVPPATYGRRGGATLPCDQTPHIGAWQHVQVQVRAVLPKTWYQGIGASNVVGFRSDSRFVTGRAYKVDLNDEYLFGGANSLHHPPIFDQTTNQYQNHQGICVTPAEHDDYAQALADQLYDFMGKRYHWDDVHGLVIDRETVGITAFWHFRGNFTNRLYPSLPPITSADLNL